MEERRFCRRHFLAYSYRSIESIAAQLQQPEFHELYGNGAAKLLEECMRHAAKIACEPVAPGNLERAQVLDVLLWASELHGRLRRGPRVPVRIPILVRSNGPGEPWEEITESQLLSRHGVQIVCRHELRIDDTLLCIRLDSQKKTDARVVWARPKKSGGVDAGLEFTTDENFWGLTSDRAVPAAGAEKQPN